MKYTLNDLKPGDTCRIIKLIGQGGFRRRLMDLGLVKGARLTLKKLAPLGDPIEIEVKGYSLSLRRAEAAKIYVEILV